MNSGKKPFVCIVILNWNGWRDTIECLESIEQLDYPNVETIVVDNASTDDSIRKIKEYDRSLAILETEENLGFSGGNNIGLRHALDLGADYIWLLNNDTVVHRHALSKLVSRMKRDPGVGICGSRLIYYHCRDTLQALGGGSYNRWLGITRHIGRGKAADLEFSAESVEDELDYIIGASMMVSKPFLEDIGFLNEDYFLYYEEIDWAVRAKSRYRLGLAKESIVYHKEGASSQGNSLHIENRSRLADYYQIRNRLKFTWNYYPWMLFSVYLSVIFIIFNRLRRGQWDRIPMILKLTVTFNRKENHQL